VTEKSGSPAISRDVLGETIEGFRRLREFLGLQLAHAWGNVTDSDFENRAEPYCATAGPVDLDLLARKLFVLHQATGLRLDQEEVSSIFRCSFEEAAQAMVASAGMKEKEPAGTLAESLLREMVMSASRGSLCTGEGKHHIEDYRTGNDITSKMADDEHECRRRGDRSGGMPVRVVEALRRVLQVTT